MHVKAGTMHCLEKMQILLDSGINPLHNGTFSKVYCLLFLNEFIFLVIFLFIFQLVRFGFKFFLFKMTILLPIFQMNS